MALHLQKKIASSWYTLADQKDEEQPAKIKIKPLDGEQYMEVFAESEQTRSGDLKLTGLGLKMTIRYGIIGWDNIFDSNGKKLKYSPHNIKQLPMEVLSEVASQIMDISSPDEEESKNS